MILKGDYSQCDGISVVGNAPGDLTFEIDAEPKSLGVVVFRCDKEGFSMGGPMKCMTREVAHFRNDGHLKYLVCHDGSDASAAALNTTRDSLMGKEDHLFVA